MNNKLIKLMAVVVLSVMVLGTCAFASTVSNPTYTKESALISFNVAAGEGATQVTYIAYADATNGTIIAIDQISAAEAAVPQNVTIDAGKITNAEKIVICSGDDVTNAASTATISLAEVVVGKSVCTNKDTMSVTFNAGTDEEITYTNVPVFKVDVTATKATGKTLAVTGLTAKSTATGEHALNTEGVELPSITCGEEGGTLTVDNVYVIGAPAEFITAEDAEIIPAWSLN